MKNMKTVVAWSLFAWCLSGCASQWKIQGGPQECTQMCANWDMELTGMVGVGNQDASGPGATACVCQKRGAAPPAANPGAMGVSTSTAAVVVAMQEAERQQQQQHHYAKPH